MPAATMPRKGQITVPHSVRQTLGLQAGDRVDFVPLDDGGLRVVALRKDVCTLRGRFAGRSAQAISLRQMAEAVELEAAQRAGRGGRAPARWRAQTGRAQ